MREELKSKRPTTSYGSTEVEAQKMDLEVKLHKANARVEALQDEMAENAKNFAKEISQLKIIISVHFLIEICPHNIYCLGKTSLVGHSFDGFQNSL